MKSEVWGLKSEVWGSGLYHPTKIFLCVLRVVRGFFLVAYGKKSLEEIFLKNGRGQKCYGSTEHTEDTEFFLVA